MPNLFLSKLKDLDLKYETYLNLLDGLKMEMKQDNNLLHNCMADLGELIYRLAKREEVTNELQESQETYSKHYTELVEKYPGKWIAIKKDKILGIEDDCTKIAEKFYKDKYVPVFIIQIPDTISTHKARDVMGLTRRQFSNNT